jgi:hypothetical protein
VTAANKTYVKSDGHRPPLQLGLNVVGEGADRDIPIRNRAVCSPGLYCA